MSFDGLVANPGRLRILTALALEPAQEFVRLRDLTQLTDGNLSTHARRLAHGGLVTIHKSFHNGKPVTRIDLTHQGRQALENHAQRVLSALQRPTLALASVEAETKLDISGPDDDWVD